MARSMNELAAVCAFSSDMLNGTTERECSIITNFRAVQPTKLIGVCSFTSDLLNGETTGECATVEFRGNTAAGNPSTTTNM